MLELLKVLEEVAAVVVEEEEFHQLTERKLEMRSCQKEDQ